ncbi:ABC transporter substrate-binding protein [Microbacterium esteraromaticum]|uniref:ABC transporter substrate-binding protein n=1 Tax=Microbacterium esteraromaticum TaxID=57043 RepID=UPI001958EE04|nr:ABC transporter substrate-binding protein [Microbacterium esteraromaticum]MBM7466360.1 polar amino acid transport system substrate-binding protein [Microbacterium esteraromaticum]
MKITQARVVLTAAAVAGALMLVGCGGKPVGSTDDDTGAAAASAVEIPTGDLAADVLKTLDVDDDLAARVPADIRKNGLAVATADGYPPMEMFDGDGETMIGVDMSFARALATLWGVELKIENSDQNAMVPGVASGRYDMVISGLNDTEVRREKVSFVDYATSAGAFVVAKGNPKGIKTPEDMCGKTLAVLDNGYYMQLAQTYSEECVAAGADKIEILGFANDPEALLQLQNGRADAGMNDFPVAQYRVSLSGDKLEAVEIPGDALFGIGIAPEATDLISLTQDTMNQLMQDGSYRDILDAWDLGGMGIDEATVNKGN